jgi:hypothetical protein
MCRYTKMLWIKLSQKYGASLKEYPRTSSISSKRSQEALTTTRQNLRNTSSLKRTVFSYKPLKMKKSRKLITLRQHKWTTSQTVSTCISSDNTHNNANKSCYKATPKSSSNNKLAASTSTSSL